MGVVDRKVFAPPSVDEVMGLLRGVMDPELGADIVTLGMATGAEVRPDGHVEVPLNLTIGGCPLRAQIKADVETRIAPHPGETF